MITLKAGCFLVDVKSKKLAIVYREKLNDYSFPKGHVENGEDVKTTAIREVAEETKRCALILDNYEPIIDEYLSSSGKHCVCHMFFAIDGGPSDNKSTDTHKVIWTDIDKVEEILSYQDLKDIWQNAKPTILDILSKNIQ